MELAFIRKFNIRRNIPLAPLTTWRVGGPARYFYEPDAEHYPEVIARASKLGIPVYFLGRGSNVLIKDGGLDGLVVCTRRSLRSVWREHNMLVAESGVPLPFLSRFAAELGFGGFEFLIGIPGTVGGGVVVNAGLTSQGVREISDILFDVDVLDTNGKVRTLTVNELAMGYRTSALLDEGAFVLRARFRLDEPAPREQIRDKMMRHLEQRRNKQPLSKWTAGSTFKQPGTGRPAGWYIERAGLKGFRIGGAMVSHKHANWIENTGNATAQDIHELIEHAQTTVAKLFDIRLEREVRYLPQDRLR